jgi:hypothetical protein
MVLSPLPDFLLRDSTMAVRWQTRDSDGASPRQCRFATTHPTQPRVEQQRPTEPAETRTFATGEICVLMIGFAIAGSAMSDASDWRRASTVQVVLGLVVYLALGLSFCGPIMVSWRERLGRRRPIWGVGESLWFAFGLPIQDGVLSTIIARWFGGASGATTFFCLILLLPFIYLTGNPQIEWARAPLSWSNIVGLLNVLLWVMAFFAAIIAA